MPERRACKPKGATVGNLLMFPNEYGDTREPGAGGQRDDEFEEKTKVGPVKRTLIRF